MPGWFPYGFAEGRVPDLMDVFVLPQKRDASGALLANKLYAARTVILVLFLVGGCSLASAVAIMRTTSRADTKAAGQPPIPKSAADAYKIVIDAEGA